MSRMQRLAFSLLFALSLALGQQAAALHELRHAADMLEQGDSPAADCPEHALFVPFAGALGSQPPVVAFFAQALPQAPAAALPAASLPTRYSFLSRAPPASPA